MMESLQTGLDDVTLVSRSARIPSFTSSVRDVFDTAVSPRVVWSAPEETTVLGSGAAATIVAAGSDRFESVRDAAESLFTTGDVHAGSEVARPRLFGGFAFHAESADGTPWEQFPNAQFVFPRVQVTWSTPDATTETNTATDDIDAWITVNAVDPDIAPDTVEDRLDQEIERLKTLDSTSDSQSPPGVTCRQRRTSRDAWNRGVTAAIDRISAGTLKKVVLAQALEVELQDTPALGDIVTHLGERYPSCYRFIIEPVTPVSVDQGVDTNINAIQPQSEQIPDASQPPAFFGATPERLVSVRGRTVETGALAGTTGRGETVAEDEWLAAELARDEKNIHEHELVAETIRDQLSPYATAITSDSRRVRKLATVQHLWTPITATLEEDQHALSLVEALHPTPAVGGLPPTTAAETIRETEPFDRGWYAAPVGWIDAAGYGTFAVALRSAVTHDDAATLFAGVGIVADSQPDSEWDEVQLKYRPILDELEDNTTDETTGEHTQHTVENSMSESAPTSTSTSTSTATATADTEAASESNSHSQTTMGSTSETDTNRNMDES